MNTATRPKTLLIYARTSKEYKGVERVSIPQQIEDAQRLATAKGYPSTLVFTDPDRSGELPQKQWAETGQRRHREGLSELIAAIERGDGQGIGFRRIDRLVRGTELTLRLIRFCQSHTIKLESTDEELPGAANVATGAGPCSSTPISCWPDAARRLQSLSPMIAFCQCKDGRGDRASRANCDAMRGAVTILLIAPASPVLAGWLAMGSGDTQGALDDATYAAQEPRPISQATTRPTRQTEQPAIVAGCG